MKMKQREILMVRKSIDRWDGVEPETLYLKRFVSREELGFDWWIVHDLEDGCWYVVDPISGLAAVREETRTAAKGAFYGKNGLIHMNAWTMRGTKVYEWARRRMQALRIRPIWDPKNESGEDFSKRLASWMKGIQYRYSPQGIEKVVFDEFAQKKDEKQDG